MRYGLGVVFLVTLVGTVLTLQGWRSRPPAFDMLTYFNSSETLLETGAPARFGDISSYGAFSPPGTTWLIAPGMLLFEDPRLYEKLGGACLYLATLLGVFLLARATFGSWCAYLSVVLYGLSGLGLSFAGSLWPIGHPAFYVWMAYLALRWVERRDARYLAAAGGVWAVGMYVDMAITPAVLVLPTLWLVYRPPLFTRAHLFAAALSLAVWYPYLQFERSRDFADLRSTLLLHSILPGNYSQAWCNPDLSLKYWDGTVAPARVEAGPSQATGSASPNLGQRLAGRIRRLASGLVANTNQVTRPAPISILMAVLALSTAVLLGIVAFYPRARIAQLLSRISDSNPMVERAATGSFVISLAVPWFVLLLVAEPDRPERFFWVWPLQAIALVAFTTNILPGLRVPARLARVSQAALLVAVLIPPLQSISKRWLREGWSGSDAEEVRVVDYVAGRIRSEGRRSAAIGYQLFIYPFMANYNIIDPAYRVGAEFEALFKYRYGIANLDRCAEGFSPADEYRILQTRPKSGEDEPRQYVAVPADNRFHLLRRFDLYQVLKRE